MQMQAGLTPRRQRFKASGMLRGIGSPAQLILTLILAGAILPPLGELVFGAFRSGAPGDPTAVFSLDNLEAAYGAFVGSGPFAVPLRNSLIIAALVTLCAVCVGVLLAWVVTRTNVPGRRFLQTAIMLPLFYSSLVSVVGWSVLADPTSGFLNQLIRLLPGVSSNFRAININSFGGIIFVMAQHYVPYVVLIVLGPMESLDASLEEAAAVAGASGPRMLWTITLRMLTPAIAASAVVVFVLAMDMFDVPGYLGSRSNIPVLAYSVYVLVIGFAPNIPLASAGSTILVLIAIALMFVYRRLLARANRFVGIGGRGHRSRRTDLGKYRLAIFGVTLLVVIVSTVLPVIGVVFRSLMAVRTISFSLSDLSLRNYQSVLGDGSLPLALGNSLIVSVAAATLCVVVAILVSFSARRQKSLAAFAANYLVSIPVAVPGIALALGLLWAYVTSPLYLTIWLIVFGVAVRFVGIAVQGASAGMAQVDSAIEEAAAVAGASTFRQLAGILLPVMGPVIVSVWLVAFVSAVRELPVSVLLYGAGTQTLPVMTWNRLLDGSYGAASAIAVVQIALVGIVYLVAGRALRGALLRGRGDSTGDVSVERAQVPFGDRGDAPRPPR